MSVDAFLDIGFDGEISRGSIVDYFELVAQNADPKVAINW
jgi:hypothetical protein